MATDDECMGYAAECERLAGLTSDPQLKEEFLKMAREWKAMATQAPPGFDVLAPEGRPRTGIGWPSSN
jgi:hypothetical protein